MSPWADMVRHLHTGDSTENSESVVIASLLPYHPIFDVFLVRPTLSVPKFPSDFYCLGKFELSHGSSRMPVHTNFTSPRNSVCRLFPGKTLGTNKIVGIGTWTSKADRLFSHFAFSYSTILAGNSLCFKIVA